MRKGFLALVLAAGEATRFRSEKNKVLYPLLGKSMLRHVLDCVFKLKPAKVYVVVGSHLEEVMKDASAKKVEFIAQRKQLGTAHAVLAAKSRLQKKKGADVLILNADLPLLSPKTLRSMLLFHRRKGNSLTFLSAQLENPKGFGRVVRSPDKIKIVEEKEASPSLRRIEEVNAGVYLFRIKDLLKALPKVSRQNKKREYYLTDLVGILSPKQKVAAFKTSHVAEIVGVNNRYELAMAVEILRERKIKALAEQGVTVYDPHTTWVDLDVRIGRDTTIYPSVIIEGKSLVGRKCRLYPFVHIINSRLGNRVKILSSTVIEESVIEDDAQVGPFSRLRPKTVVRSGAKVGNFVEMKNTVFGKFSKAGHLSYLGDCQVKDRVNVGAGTITCNYDGRKKHRTTIEAGAFIGSGTELVAPLKIGKGAYIGAGSTITKDVRPGSLAVSRSKQVEKPGWARRLRRG